MPYIKVAKLLIGEDKVMQLSNRALIEGQNIAQTTPKRAPNQPMFGPSWGQLKSLDRPAFSASKQSPEFLQLGPVFSLFWAAFKACSPTKTRRQRPTQTGFPSGRQCLKSPQLVGLKLLFKPLFPMAGGSRENPN